MVHLLIDFILKIELYFEYFKVRNGLKFSIKLNRFSAMSSQEVVTLMYDVITTQKMSGL